MSTVFKWPHFEHTIILQCVRLYLKYGIISYRDLSEMIEERGVSVCHTTLYPQVCFQSRSECRVWLRTVKIQL